ncbi:MAG: hypothetical protein Ct9H300mP30_4730 [Methanobacteriota archaeon]|nr:MAG: hypothetical protein Ct9H300mP30_4730 [Euryarchaeota archaeon]
MASGPYPGADTIFTEVYEEMPGTSRSSSRSHGGIACRT